jgi:hypothetical protein
MQNLGLTELLIPAVLLMAYLGIPVLIVLSAVYAYRNTQRRLDQVLREIQAIKMELARQD